jgi:hypothetical protein
MVSMLTRSILKQGQDRVCGCHQVRIIPESLLSATNGEAVYIQPTGDCQLLALIGDLDCFVKFYHLVKYRKIQKKESKALSHTEAQRVREKIF